MALKLRERFSKMSRGAKASLPATASAAVVLSMLVFPAAAHGQTGPAPNDNRADISFEQNDTRTVDRKADDYSLQEGKMGISVVMGTGNSITPEQYEEALRELLQKYGVDMDSVRFFIREYPTEPGKGGIYTTYYIQGHPLGFKDPRIAVKRLPDIARAFTEDRQLSDLNLGR